MSISVNKQMSRNQWFRVTGVRWIGFGLLFATVLMARGRRTKDGRRRKYIGTGVIEPWGVCVRVGERLKAAGSYTLHHETRHVVALGTVRPWCFVSWPSLEGSSEHSHVIRQPPTTDSLSESRGRIEGQPGRVVTRLDSLADLYHLGTPAASPTLPPPTHSLSPIHPPTHLSTHTPSTTLLLSTSMFLILEMRV